MISRPPRVKLLAVLPVELLPVLVKVTILATQFAAFVSSGAIVAVSQVTTQFTAVVRNLPLVVADVAMQTAVTRKSRRYSHSNHQ